MDASGRRPSKCRGVSQARRGRVPPALDLKDVPVRGPLEGRIEGKLVRTVDDHEAFRARLLERGDGLFRGEMAAKRRLACSYLRQGRLAEEEIGVARKVDQGVARSGVARVGKRALTVRDPKAIG